MCFVLYIVFKSFSMYWTRQAFSRGFEEVKDLIRGSISADVGDIQDAYEYFKVMPGVKIIEIKSLDKIHELKNITVLYMFEE